MHQPKIYLIDQEYALEHFLNESLPEDFDSPLITRFPKPERVLSTFGTLDPPDAIIFDINTLLVSLTKTQIIELAKEHEVAVRVAIRGKRTSSTLDDPLLKAGIQIVMQQSEIATMLIPWLKIRLKGKESRREKTRRLRKSGRKEQATQTTSE